MYPKITIIDEENPVTESSAPPGAMGGTELMMLGLKERLPKEFLDNFQIICSRPRSLDPHKIRILWCHDHHEDPEVQHLKTEEGRNRYDWFVFVSNWQMHMYNSYLGVPFERSVVIPNSIIPLDFDPKKFIFKEDKPRINFIYTPTPHRGLELLYPVFDKLVQDYKDTYDLHLNVFSSFKLYGCEERDKTYLPLFDKLKSHPNITYHGTVKNSVIRDYLMKSHIFAYPSIWPETSCLCLIEAMSAGLICVHPNYGALIETSKSYTYQYQWQENHNNHASKFYFVLRNILDIMKKLNELHVLGEIQSMTELTNRYHDWNVNINNWFNFLNMAIRNKNR